MKRYFHKFRDDRFALTAMKNLLVAKPCPPRRALLLALSVREGSVQRAELRKCAIHPESRQCRLEGRRAATQAPPPHASASIPTVQFISNRDNPDSEIWQTNENKRERIF